MSHLTLCRRACNAWNGPRQDSNTPPAVLSAYGIPIGVNRPAIVREIPHFDVFPAFTHFSENVPHFLLNFEKQIS